MAYCQGCGAVNDSDTTSCGACGRVLSITCGQCGKKNPTAARFCDGCGRSFAVTSEASLSETDEKIPSSDSDGEIASGGLSKPLSWRSPSTVPPIGPFLKAVIGSFVFVLLFITQALSGSPVFGILAGLVSGAVALWGIVEIVWWFIQQAESSGAVSRRVKEADDLFPDKVRKGISGDDGSFADVDAEAAGTFPGDSVISSATSSFGEASDTVEKSRNKSRSKKVPFDLEPSMVAPADALDAELDIVVPSRPEGPSESGSDAANDALLNDIDDGAEAAADARKAHTLAEFLDQGVNHEIAVVERKLLKAPRNFSLLVRIAQLYEERGEVSKALSAMDDCLSFHPQDAEIFLYHGILLRRSGELDRARKAFEKALSVNKYMSKAFYQLGSLERASHRLEAARDIFQRCIQLSPDDPYAHYQLGMTYHEMGDLETAQMEIKRACLLNPNDSYGHSRLGQIYQQARKWELAVHEYSQALAIKPNDAFVLEKLAEVMVEKGELGRVCDLYQEALANQFHPDPRTMIAFARVLFKLGKITEMKPLLEDVMRMSPNHPDALYLMAQSLSAEKNIEGALGLLGRLTSTQPERWDAWLETGRLLQSLDKMEEALAAYVKASPNANDQAGIWNTIGILLSNLKRYEEALRAFKKAVSFDYSDGQIQANLRSMQKKVESECRRIIESAGEKLSTDPNMLEAYLDMGYAYELLDRPEDAMMAYQKLLSIKPDSIDGLLSYAKLLRLRGKLKMAMRCYREILKIKNDHVPARLQLVKANLNLGFVNEALRHAVAVQKIVPEDPETHFLLGKIYFAKGLTPRALKEFTFVASHATDSDMVSWAEILRRRLTKAI
ncbi:MAG: tetratricopeptide repeat protein [Candidatus Riflebacteria bacterium]|nr:tetratricopeptide repeat protein [Candidatus Riflebacteria bacterium]